MSDNKGNCWKSAKESIGWDGSEAAFGSQGECVKESSSGACRSSWRPDNMVYDCRCVSAGAGAGLDSCSVHVSGAQEICCSVPDGEI